MPQSTRLLATLATLRQQLATDTEYFCHVYNYTFTPLRAALPRASGPHPAWTLGRRAFAHSDAGRAGRGTSTWWTARRT
ncbi:hypothetical protein LXA43DRAFT_1097237 [Ganoderma leucocontextum]|nr:hypothetical protein LXA43DRAFT_1097237 [Ganoderma leucocontextum]